LNISPILEAKTFFLFGKIAHVRSKSNHVDRFLIMAAYAERHFKPFDVAQDRLREKFFPLFACSDTRGMTALSVLLDEPLASISFPR